MRFDRNSFSIYDASINIHTPHGGEDWNAYKAIRVLFKENGFRFHQDPDIKKRYRCLAKTHFAGSRRGVHFTSHIYPAGFEYSFYEDVIRDNPNGGKYHFDKMAKMPYLRRLAVQLIRRKVIGWLLENGFQDHSGKNPSDADEWIRAHRESLEDFQGHDFYVREKPSYNTEDGDKRTLRDGDLRYFRDYSGHLLRGLVYHHINNMWWVKVSPFEARNIGAHDLFSYDPARHKQKEVPRRIEKMKRNLARHIKREEFEKCAGLRDAIKAVS